MQRDQSSGCRVYWGSHGCMLERGHGGDHLCTCAVDIQGRVLSAAERERDGIVGAAPYYGPDTKFYGEDVS